MDEHMLIEVDHMSEWARQRVLEIAAERDYPLVSSHTNTGGTWVESELERLEAVGGFASATLDSAEKLPAKVLAFGRPVGLSSDTGGFASLPGPEGARIGYPFRLDRVRFQRQRTGERTFDLNQDGMAHYGLLPDHLADMAARPQGREALRVLMGGARAYLRTWSKAERP
jgi:hypothetical protein